MKRLAFLSAAAVAIVALGSIPAFAGGDGGSGITPVMLPPDDPCALIDAARRDAAGGRCRPSLADKGAQTSDQPYGPRFSNRNRTPAVQVKDANHIVYRDGSTVARRSEADGRQYLMIRYHDGSMAFGYGGYIEDKSGNGAWRLTTRSGLTKTLVSDGPHMAVQTSETKGGR